MTKPKAPKPKPRVKAKGGASQQSAQLRRRAFAEAYLSNNRNALRAAPAASTCTTWAFATANATPGCTRA